MMVVPPGAKQANGSEKGANGIIILVITVYIGIDCALNN